MNGTSLTVAAVALAAICNRIDEEEEVLDDILKKEFSDALTNVAQSVEHIKNMVNEIDSKITLAKRIRDEITQQVKRYQKIKERTIELTKETILNNPDIPFKDSLGRDLSVRRNPNPKLIITRDEDVPEEFLVTRKELDKEKLKKAILDGTDVDYAILEYGTQLRGIK